MAIQLKNQKPGVQFAVFFGLTVGMIIVNMLFNSVFFGDLSANLLTDKPLLPEELMRYKWFQLASSLMIFAVPPLLYGYLADERPLSYLGVRPNAHAGYLFMTIALLVAAQPLAMVLGEWNRQADFGETIRNMEQLSDKTMQKFLAMKSGADLLVNIMVVAVVPAIAEELFFRGSLQNILEKWTGRPGIAIVVSSLLFGLFHLSFYKILPIFLLGMVLATLFYITRNLWYSIFFHFVNNAMALLATYYAQHNDLMKKLADDEVKLSWWAGLVSLVVVLAIFYLFRRKFPYQPLQKTWAKEPFTDAFNNPS